MSSSETAVNGVIFIPPQPDPPIVNETQFGGKPCHPLAIHAVEVDLVVVDDAVAITARVRTADRTGVEMEALTAVAVAGLAIVDMVKSVDKGAVITDLRIEEKLGGKSGVYRRAEVVA